MKDAIITILLALFLIVGAFSLLFTFGMVAFLFAGGLVLVYLPMMLLDLIYPPKGGDQ